jgi:flagellar biosynthesis/type III secretory pathway protein FliH
MSNILKRVAESANEKIMYRQGWEEGFKDGHDKGFEKGYEMAKNKYRVKDFYDPLGEE